ncbi:unnamed protein product, partial [Prorocentrum cordatum]
TSLANLGDYLSKALAGAGLAGDPDATRLATEFSTLASQKLVAAPAPLKPPHAQLKAQSKFDEAAAAVMAAELHCMEVQVAANPPETAKQSLFGVDPELLESLDELEENDKQALEQFQKQLQDVTQQAEAKHKEQKEFQALLERARRRPSGARAAPMARIAVQESDQKAMLERIKASAQAQAREAAASKAAISGKVAVADPESKRSKMREKQRQRRLQSLPIELQEGFDELEPPASPPAPSASFAIPEVLAGIGSSPADKTTESFGEKSTAEEIELWKAMAADLDRVPVGQLPSLVDTARKWAGSSSSRALLAPRASFMKWAKEPRTSKPGAARRHVKQAPPLEWEGSDSTGAIATDKQRAVMDQGAGALSFEHAVLFLDLAKFYNSVSFVLVLQDARGPIAAVQATLLQIDMLGAFMGDCAQLQWKKAAHHEAGEDMAAGADMKTAQIEFNRLAAQSKFDERAADIALISGGQWTRERQIAAGPNGDFWVRAARALRNRGPGGASVWWTPSHKEDKLQSEDSVIDECLACSFSRSSEELADLMQVPEAYARALEQSLPACRARRALLRAQAAEARAVEGDPELSEMVAELREAAAAGGAPPRAGGAACCGGLWRGARRAAARARLGKRAPRAPRVRGGGALGRRGSYRASEQQESRVPRGHDSKQRSQATKMAARMRYRLPLHTGRGRVNVCADVDTTTLHNMARLALEMCPSRELPTRRAHIYTDGSYNGIPHTAAWAVVIVDEYDDGRNSRGPFGFRGFIAGKATESLHDMVNSEKVTAYTAELTAVLWALMWALGQDTAAPIEITPDALNVINLASDKAQCHVHPKLGAAIRTLAGLLQQARPTQWHHINSHIGHPWNELADGIADQASASDLMDPNTAPVQAIAHNKFRSWEWLRSAPDAVKAAYPPMRNQAFIIGATQPQAAPCAIQRPISTTTIKADLSLNLCTYNCRSLKAAVSFKSGKGKAASKRKQSISKVTHLAAQFADMGLHVVALQETQSEGDVRNVGKYGCYSSGHTQQNRGGDIWLNVSQPISVSGTAKYLSAKDTLVPHQHDRLLIIKTRVAGTDMVIASAYAPHEDSQAAEKTELWESAKRLSAKYHVDTFMGDLNGRLGDYESPGVGASGYPEPTNGNGKHIISFAADTDMEVINTTKDPGNNSYTHIGSKGQRHRIDYVLLSSSIAPYVASCSTEPGPDRGTAAQDHIPVLATLKWAVCKNTKASGPRPDLTNLNNDDAKASFKEILKQAPIIPWEVDVNTHCEEVTRVVNNAAIQAFGKAVKAARKPYATKTTMGLIRARRLTLRAHRAVLRGEAHDDRPGRLVAHAHSLLGGEVGASLALWSRERGDDDGTIHDIHDYAHLLLNWTISPMVYAMAILSFLTRSGLLVASAVEKDRSAFLSRLASTASSASAANDAAAQWKAYRDRLRYGGRKAKFLAGQPMRLDKDGEVIHNSQDMADQELNHFAKIQAGKIVTADDLANKYNHDSKTRPFDGTLDLSMVMPLAVCQAQFAAAKAGAQGGPDGLTNAVLRAAPTEAAALLHPLFTKVATTVREPLSFKGGDLVAIPKGKGDPRYLLAYREILLNNVLGKHHHKYLRAMLNTTLAVALEDIQVGGRPKRGADMAALAARLFTERSQAQGKCSMISCYDLKEAFYSVVVQLVHGIPGEEDEVKEVLDNLEVPRWAQPQLEHLMANPGILDTVLDGSHLAALIAEGHRNRWTSHRFSQNFMAPHKGTRPGVPLADADFNLLFGRVHRMIDSYLTQRSSYRAKYCHFDQHDGAEYHRIEGQLVSHCFNQSDGEPWPTALQGLCAAAQDRLGPPKARALESTAGRDLSWGCALVRV